MASRHTEIIYFNSETQSQYIDFLSEAKKSGKNKSAIVREALDLYIERYGSNNPSFSDDTNMLALYSIIESLELRVSQLLKRIDNGVDIDRLNNENSEEISSETIDGLNSLLIG